MLVQFCYTNLRLLMEPTHRMDGSIGKNDSNREMNLRAKENVMNQLINHHACDKMKGHNNVTRMVITKARAMTFGLGGKLKLLLIRNALFSLFILLETAQVWNRATTVRNFRNFNRTSCRYVRANPCFAYCMC